MQGNVVLLHVERIQRYDTFLDQLLDEREEPDRLWAVKAIQVCAGLPQEGGMVVEQQRAR